MTNGFEQGMYEGVAKEDYLQAMTPQGLAYVSGGTLIAGRPPRTPAHMLAHLDGTAKEESSGFSLGTLCHAVLEPGRLEEHYAAWPENINFATNKGKADLFTWMTSYGYVGGPPESRRKDEWLALFLEQTGHLAVSAEDYDKAKTMCASIADDERAPKLFAFPDGLHEVSCFWIDPLTGIGCRARPDYMSVRGRIIVDVKTTAKTASREDFEWTISKYGYHIKAHWYRSVVAELTDTQAHGWDFWFIAIESNPPYLAKAWRLDSRALSAAAEETAELWETFADCWRSGVWPGYPEDVYEIGLPDKVLNKFK